MQLNIHNKAWVFLHANKIFEIIFSFVYAYAKVPNPFRIWTVKITNFKYIFFMRIKRCNYFIMYLRLTSRTIVALCWICWRDCQLAMSESESWELQYNAIVFFNHPRNLKEK